MNRRTGRWSIISVFLLIFYVFFNMPYGAAAQDNCGGIADKVSHGFILWTENAILAQGTAAPNLSDPKKPVSVIKRETQRAATLDAYRKIAGVLNGLNVTSTTFASDSPHVISRINAYVRQPKICKTKYYADGGVDMVVKVPLSGELVKALLPDAGRNVASARSKYTGLIVDASTVAFYPAIAPRLLAPDGTVLYSQEKVKLDVVVKRGAVKYVENRKAIKKDHVGHRPLKTTVTGLGALSPGDLVVDRKSASILAGSPAFLGNGKVVIITSPIRKIDCRGLAGTEIDQRIDWERKIVVARGTGRVNFARKMDDSVRMRMMEKAAEVDAQRKLLELILKINVGDHKILKNTLSTYRQIEGVVKNAVRCGAKYFKDGSAEVVLAAPIDGIAFEGEVPGKMVPPDITVVESHVSGLIIDASDLAFKPSLTPKLLGPDGRELYGADMVSPAYVRQYGVAGYSSSLDQAKTDQRTGDQPLVVHAGRVAENPSQLVLASGDANKIAQLNNMSGPLSQGRVIIITKNVCRH
ncbi:MAG: hypothetical protein SWH54_01160 [Thermodesulfobacteriota bacterium]|nr:hypothetical protein [Thermodesulfobacteriota bacterium]